MKNSFSVKLNSFPLITSMFSIILFIVCFACSSGKIEYPRGIDLKNESFAPKLVKSNKYRNIALQRPAFHSSSYNNNLTAQLVNDGITDSIPPLWMKVTSSHKGIVSKQEREYLFDRNKATGFRFNQPKGWIKLESNHFAAFNVVDSFAIIGKIRYRESGTENWEFTLSNSTMGIHYEPVKTIKGNKLTGKQVENHSEKVNEFETGASLGKPMRNRFYKLDFSCGAALDWEISEVCFFYKGKQNEIGGPQIFTSAWKSGGNKNEWIIIDLGEKSRFNHVKVYWLDPAKEALLETSDDGLTWKTFETISGNTSTISEFNSRKNIKGRFIRINMLEPVNEIGYSINEIEVYGKGGPLPRQADGPVQVSDDNILLSGGNWKLQRSSLVQGNALRISKIGYDDSGWIIATIPATVIKSYYNAGIIPDPDNSETQQMISESFFFSDFWYRNEFVVPESFSGKNISLHFEGIYPKADIFVNGENFGTIKSPLQKDSFDISRAVVPGELNAIAVKIYKTNMFKENIVDDYFNNPEYEKASPISLSAVKPGIIRSIFLISGGE
ncbi:MAG: discoidin domain-containing protein [Prolixibacteraceae bacterium]|nr:discoidin domain-containing protein [Prolixibacteraceae bacterium]